MPLTEIITQASSTAPIPARRLTVGAFCLAYRSSSPTRHGRERRSPASEAPWHCRRPPRPRPTGETRRLARPSRPVKARYRVLFRSPAAAIPPTLRGRPVIQPRCSGLLRGEGRGVAVHGLEMMTLTVFPVVSVFTGVPGFVSSGGSRPVYPRREHTFFLRLHHRRYRCRQYCAAVVLLS